MNKKARDGKAIAAEKRPTNPEGTQELATAKAKTKTGIILMGRIKYQEAIGLEVGEISSPPFHRFITSRIKL